MGACLITNSPRDLDNTTLPSPTPLRVEIQAELNEKALPICSSNKLRKKTGDEPATSLKSKSIIKSESKSENGSKVLSSNRSLQGLEQADSGPRTVKQVIIGKDHLPASLTEHTERRTIQQQREEEEYEQEEGQASEASEQYDGPQVETPANRLAQPQGNMLNCGLTDTDNRMIALTMAAKEPLRLNAVKLKNGSIYNGQWLGGKRHGRGVLTWEDGSRYEGEWRNNFSWGYGKLIFNEHQYYEGDFVRNNREGHGRYTNFGVLYEGEWHNDRQEGHGKESWGKNEHYEGEWLGGYKHGYGEMKFQDGSYYKGNFSGNEIHGKGHYCWNNSRSYEGEWEHNRMYGMGVLIWNNGEKYEGQFKNDKMHGMGLLTHPNWSTSAGIFENGKKHGVFTETDPEGNVRQVEYYMGKRMRGQDLRPHKPRNRRSYQSKTLSSVTHSF